MSQAIKTADADMPIYGPMGMSFMEFPFDANIQQTQADVLVSGVPFDLATSGRSGARMGPSGIRAASANLVWEGARYPWDFALDDHLTVKDCGNVTFKHGEPQTLVDNLEHHIGQILQSGKSPLTFGGDHFITLPILRAIAKEHGPVALIHFDAHTDTYSGGSKYDHGTFLYHAMEEGLIDTEHSIQIGIRTVYTKKDYPLQVLDAAWVADHGPQKTLEEIRRHVGNKKTYLTFDIDGIDPSFAPGTGTPVTAGITTDCALKIIRGLQGIHLIGMDLVEVAPVYDHSDVTSLAAATLCLEYLYVLASNKQKGISSI